MIDTRRAMTPARQQRIWEREKGICWWCGQPVPVRGNVRYDHKVPLDLKGSDDDSEIFPLHRNPCDIEKTKGDRPRIDKARRLRKTRQGLDKPKKGIQSRRFEKPRVKTRWAKRPFPARKT